MSVLGCAVSARAEALRVACCHTSSGGWRRAQSAARPSLRTLRSSRSCRCPRVLTCRCPGVPRCSSEVQPERGWATRTVQRLHWPPIRFDRLGLPIPKSRSRSRRKRSLYGDFRTRPPVPSPGGWRIHRQPARGRGPTPCRWCRERRQPCRITSWTASQGVRRRGPAGHNPSGQRVAGAPPFEPTLACSAHHRVTLRLGR